MIFFPTGLEDTPTGSINPTGIFDGNWEKINNIFDPAHTGDQAGVLAAALAGMTTITYAGTITLDLNAGRPLQLVTLTGALTVAVSNKNPGRARRLIIVGDGTDRALTWPVGAVWAGPPVVSVPAGKTVVVDVAATSTTDASLVLTSASVFDHVTAADLTAALSGYVTGSSLTTTLSGYVTAAALTTALGGYVTTTGAQTVTNKALQLVTQFSLAAGAYVQLTTSRALNDDDNGKILYSTSGSDITVTAPDSLTKPFACSLKQEAAGAIIVAVSGTAVLRNFDTHTKTAGQWATAAIDYRTGNDVVLTGRTAA